MTQPPSTWAERKAGSGLWDGPCPLCGGTCIATVRIRDGVETWRCNGGRDGKEIRDAVRGMGHSQGGGLRAVREESDHSQDSQGDDRARAAQAASKGQSHRDNADEAAASNVDAWTNDGVRAQRQKQLPPVLGQALEAQGGDATSEGSLRVATPGTDGGVGAGRASPNGRLLSPSGAAANGAGRDWAGNGAGGGHGALAAPSLFTPAERWKVDLGYAAQFFVEEKGIRDVEELALRVMERTGVPSLAPPAELSQTEQEEEIWAVARRMLGVVDNAEKRSALIVEDQARAVEVNREYLARPEVIERLGYAQSIALMIGGKHHGKTTNIRTLALSVIRGLPIWGRATTQGPVIYAASDDEVASTRNELLQMGWDERHDVPLRFAHIDPQSDATPEQILQEIAELAVTSRATLIILDMLFDFVGIRDELSYAATRQAIGMVQRLADNAKCLAVGSHHTPKYLTDAHNAANAALGSQGVSARFSPIILTRKWTEGLFTVESTTTRDPRGLELKPQRITKNPNGWIEVVGEFKEWMKWEIYAERVMALFEGGDPTRGYAVQDVADKLEIDRARAQNTLYQLTQLAKLKREKHGRGFRYYLAGTSMFDREGGNFSRDDTTS